MRLKRLVKLFFVPAIIVLVGTILNVIVIQANEGMPANTGYGVMNHRACDILGFPYPKHIPIYDGTKFPYLADILPFGFSVGDILILGGLIAYGIILILGLKGKLASE
jgi:hypothetical protein